MLNRKQTRAIQKFIYSAFKQFLQLSRTAGRKLSRWLSRNLLKVNRRQRRYDTAKAGFVLPTVTLLLIVVSLVIAAILFRTSSRTNQVIGAREEQIIYNAATPAIERAKAKLEYLFLRDPRFPSGPPSDEMLMSMLTNNPNLYNPPLTYQLNQDPYTLPDERQNGLPGRLNLNPTVDGNVDPAWAYKIDVDGDGRDETVVYSITLKRRNADGSVRLETGTDREKALQLVVRNGPINTIGSTNNVCSTLTQPPPPANNQNVVRATNESDWFPVGSAVLRKTFQVDAIVVSSKRGTSRTVATLEFQQDRQLDRGNKWGAWFRYDMEIFPGFDFRWNGAMYTAGNLIVGNNTFRSYLISAPNSCFYSRDASEITVNQNILPTENPLNPNFQGQIIAGQVDSNTYNGGALFHVMRPDNTVNASGTDTVLNTTTDSLISDFSPIVNISLDPVALLTEDKSRSRDSTFNNTTLRDTRRNTDFDRTNASGGQAGYFNTTKRIFNRSETPPFIDDTYRADDRYGPKPSYGRNKEVLLNNAGKRNGVKITDAGDRVLLSSNVVDPLDTDYRNLGWDGYWERRATLAGLRVIVGERLQLGNPYGWTNNDPLYPPDAAGLLNQNRQRRTLRDNLAAVQATAVYHVANPNGAGNEPIACLATTIHPGTQATLDLSKDFRTNFGQLPTNFFTGKGTNGWEYNTPPTLSGAWDTALNNLARFAGEIDGAFPPRQEPGRIHPNPFLTMWGNFSNLRRSMEDTNNSIADSTYKYTAACTMGMLAQNIVDIRTQAQNIINANPGYWNSWSSNLATAGEGTTPTLRANSAADEYIKSASPDATQREQARTIALWQQIERDRNFGFVPIPTAATPAYSKYQYQVQWLTSTPPVTTPPTPSTAYAFAGVTYDAATTTDTATQKKNLALSCNYQDPVANGGLNYFGLGAPSSWAPADRVTKEKQFIRLAVSLCPSGGPKFPSLYYLFPTQGRPDRNSLDPAINASEPYIQQTNAAGIPTGGFTQLDPSQIALAPRAIGDWRLPRTTDATGRSPQTRIDRDGAQEYVSLIDTALYNGREMMAVRTLNVDLDLLRRNNVPGASDTWLPGTGIVYAFREDAVREDAIVRPAVVAWGSCDTDAELRTQAGCQMNLNTPQDPPLSDRGISTKPVDYYPDPDRRPHGFRLRRGQNISRGTDNPRGLSFVSDNPVYIQGDFNFHSTNGNANDLEEFTQTLSTDWSNFYTRSTLDNRFARPATDTWRPSEILADSVTILSNNFVEGTIEQGITNSGGRHSFLAMNGPNTARTWVREDGTTSNTTLPIKVSRNGDPMYCSATPTPTAGQLCPTANVVVETSYRPLNTNYWGSINDASATRVNATIISGILPSRQNQSYGGFQNFPRFIENWGGNTGTTMAISGSFIQLSFSNYGTGPFLQNAWEPQTGDPGAAGFPQYYLAPGRQWGYDVGLQYAPAGPVAQRFVLPPASRSEFYRDLKADDPYICRLRRALNTIDNTLDPASQAECSDTP